MVKLVGLGGRLRRLRKEHNLTQQALASLVQVSVSAVSSYESGERYPTYDVLISYARIFHVSTDYLLGLEKTRTLDVTGLSEKQIEALTRTIDAFLDKK